MMKVHAPVSEISLSEVRYGIFSASLLRCETGITLEPMDSEIMSDAVFKKVSILTNRALMLLANCCVLIICWSSMTAAV